MRKFFLTCLAVLFGVTSYAQNDSGLFRHLSVGVNLGTPGVGLDVATPINNHLQLRAGFSLLPVTVNVDYDISGSYPHDVASQFGALHLPDEIDVKAKMKMNTGKILLDIYPSKNNSFHLTAGAYIGGSEVVSMSNAKEGALSAINQANSYIQQWNQANPGHKYSEIGLELGDYFLTPDNRGNLKGAIKTSAFKPYVGVGFGRAVPKKNVGFMFELGAMIWGSPKLYCNDVELNPHNIDSDEGEFLRILSDVTVYPVMNFRLCFKAF